MSSGGYRLTALRAAQLRINELTARDQLLAEAELHYSLGHNRSLVASLVKSARFHNREAIRYAKRSAEK